MKKKPQHLCEPCGKKRARCTPLTGFYNGVVTAWVCPQCRRKWIPEFLMS